MNQESIKIDSRTSSIEITPINHELTSTHTISETLSDTEATVLLSLLDYSKLKHLGKKEGKAGLLNNPGWLESGEITLQNHIGEPLRWDNHKTTFKNPFKQGKESLIKIALVKNAVLYIPRINKKTGHYNNEIGERKGIIETKWVEDIIDNKGRKVRKKLFRIERNINIFKRLYIFAQKTNKLNQFYQTNYYKDLLYKAEKDFKEFLNLKGYDWGDLEIHILNNPVLYYYFCKDNPNLKENYDLLKKEFTKVGFNEPDFKSFLTKSQDLLNALTNPKLTPKKEVEIVVKLHQSHKAFDTLREVNIKKAYHYFHKQDVGNIMETSIREIFPEVDYGIKEGLFSFEEWVGKPFKLTKNLHKRKK
jgi:hypothetical protein